MGKFKMFLDDISSGSVSVSPEAGYEAGDHREQSDWYNKGSSSVPKKLYSQRRKENKKRKKLGESFGKWSKNPSKGKVEPVIKKHQKPCQDQRRGCRYTLIIVGEDVINSNDWNEVSAYMLRAVEQRKKFHLDKNY